MGGLFYGVLGTPQLFFFRFLRWPCSSVLPLSLSMRFSIVAGSYEAFLYGYVFNDESHSLDKPPKAKVEEEEEIDDYVSEEEGREEEEREEPKTTKLKDSNKIVIRKKGEVGIHQQFGYRSHVDGIQSLSISYPLLATGSGDETVKIYHLQKQKEVGQMLFHKGSVSALAFSPGSLHLLSASLDGSIAVWRKKDWEIVTSFSQGKESAGGVTGMAMHPSSRVCLTACQDNRIRLWDLMRSSCMYTTKQFPEPIQSIKWANSGDIFGVALKTTIQFYRASGQSIGSVSLDKYTAIAPFEFLGSSYFCVGQSNKIKLYEIEDEEEDEEGEEEEEKSLSIHQIGEELESHGEARIRDFSSIQKEEGEGFYLVSVSAGGSICIWDLFSSSAIDPKPIGVIETGAHLTCVALGTHKKPKVIFHPVSNAAELIGTKEKKLKRKREAQPKKEVQVVDRKRKRTEETSEADPKKKVPRELSGRIPATRMRKVPNVAKLRKQKEREREKTKDRREQEQSQKTKKTQQQGGKKKEGGKKKPMKKKSQKRK